MGNTNKIANTNQPQSKKTTWPEKLLLTAVGVCH